MNTTEIMSQTLVNKMYSLETSRRRNKEAVYDRIISNNKVQDLIEELSFVDGE